MYIYVYVYIHIYITYVVQFSEEQCSMYYILRTTSHNRYVGLMCNN